MADYAIDIFSTAPSKSAVKKAIKKGLLLVDNKKTTTAQFIRGNEIITCNKETTASVSKEFQLKLTVVYEDDSLAVIHKPAGILVNGNTFKTIDNALVQNLKRSTLPDACRPRPVHRLDYATTGLLLIGKTKTAITSLNQLFENKKIQKRYLAIAIGEMKREGSILEPIDDKNAESNYKVLTTVKSERFGCLNFVLLEPKTGRRHQLRKHLAQIGNGILGDREYGKPELLLKGKGMYLHAYSLEFIHPLSGEKLLIQSPVPKRIQKIIGVEFQFDANSSFFV